jgi:hypothetical protein
MAPHGQPGKREPLNEDTWIAGDRIRVDGETSQKGPMFVEWEAPEQLTRPSLIVLDARRRLPEHRVVRYA